MQLRARPTRARRKRTMIQKVRDLRPRPAPDRTRRKTSAARAVDRMDVRAVGRCSAESRSARLAAPRRPPRTGWCRWSEARARDGLPEPADAHSCARLRPPRIVPGRARRTRSLRVFSERRWPLPRPPAGSAAGGASPILARRSSSRGAPEAGGATKWRTKQQPRDPWPHWRNDEEPRARFHCPTRVVRVDRSQSTLRGATPDRVSPGSCTRARAPSTRSAVRSWYHRKSAFGLTPLSAGRRLGAGSLDYPALVNRAQTCRRKPASRAQLQLWLTPS